MRVLVLCLLSVSVLCQSSASLQCESYACDPAWVGDNECDFECFNESCYYDGGDCRDQLCGSDLCILTWVGDGECDTNCDNRECNYDGGDCDQVSFLQIED